MQVLLAHRGGGVNKSTSAPLPFAPRAGKNLALNALAKSAAGRRRSFNNLLEFARSNHETDNK